PTTRELARPRVVRGTLRPRTLMLTKNLRPARRARFMRPWWAGFTAWGLVAVSIHIASHSPEAFGLQHTFLGTISETLLWTDVGIPFGAIGALGSALAIFLGFRNNTSYDRWWEARKIWGALVNDSRSWCRQAIAWTEAATEDSAHGTDAAALSRQLIHRHLAFVHGLALHLRKDPALLERVGEFVPPEEAARYAEVPNIPTAILIEQGKQVALARSRGQIEHFRHLEMDQLLTRLSDIQGKCERIKNTPLPRQYDAFPRWFTYVYGAVLPFGLAHPLGWAAAPVGAVITVMFLLLEGSGRAVENPFEGHRMDTPMTALAVTIERDLRAALGEPLPDAAQPDEVGALL
ncbi:MAG: bestrophin family ion channel, partial [Myxococcota bacterium]